MTSTKEARSIVKEFLNNKKLDYTNISAKSVGFTDLLRTSAITVRVSGLKRGEHWTELEKVGRKEGFLIYSNEY